MNWIGNSEVVVGGVLAVLWWLALRVAHTDKPLSSMGFAFWPTLFLLWIVVAVILIAHGVGVV
jgi:hypothetical protein